jgi:hypothetical protein
VLKNKFLRTFLFYLDKYLPRTLARLPYSFAATCISLKFKKLKKCEIWFRNSYIENSFVFGISDLDISVLLDEFDFKLITDAKNAFREMKMLFPFMGEVNFYIKNQILNLSASINQYEELRDPKLKLLLNNTHDFDEKTEKIVFLLRALISDKKNLILNPQLRQRKWKNHFYVLGLKIPSFINKDIIINEALELFNSEKQKDEVSIALNFIFSPEAETSDIFSVKKPLFWKFLFPHRYLWKDDLESEDLNLIEGSILKMICIRQIDWEIWGINSQLPFIPNHDLGIQIHMGRLRRVAMKLSSSDKLIARIDYMIENAEKF